MFIEPAPSELHGTRSSVMKSASLGENQRFGASGVQQRAPGPEFRMTKLDRFPTGKAWRLRDLLVGFIVSYPAVMSIQL
jgi:hypothetical protein